MSGWRSMWHDIRRYRWNSILFRNFKITILLLLVPIALVHLAVYAYNEKVLQEEISRTSLTDLMRLRDAFDNLLLGTENMAMQLISQPEFTSVLRDDFTYPLKPELVTKIHRIQYAMRLAKLTNSYLETLRIYVKSSDYVIAETSGSVAGMQPMSWWVARYEARSERSGVEFISPVATTVDQAAEWICFFFKMPVSQVDESGMIFASLDMKKIKRLVSLPEEGELLITDAAGQIIYASNPQPHSLLLSNYMQQTEYSDIVQQGEANQVVSVAPSAYKDWRYVSVLPLEHYAGKQVKFRQFMIYLVLLGVVSGLLFSFIISLQSYQPISGILAMLRAGRPTAAALDDKRHEIKYIAQTISRSQQQQGKLEQELQSRYALLQRAQAIALQAQINPHFLYNTLELINMKAVRLAKGKNEVSEMITTLSRLLRLSLVTEKDIIPLRTELEHVQLYLQIQQLRLKDRLQVNWTVNESILEYDTIKLTLQPLVENAIYHGLPTSPRTGVISIIGYEETGAIVLRIRDNGVGIPKHTVDRINQHLLQAPIRENESIGLRNVNQRIKLVYGEAYGLRLTSVEGEGTLVEMRLPKRKAE